MILFPIVGLLLGLILRLDPLSLRVLIIESGVPVMMSSVVLGSEYGLDVEFILTVILITTVLVLVSLPLINSILGVLIPS